MFPNESTVQSVDKAVSNVIDKAFLQSNNNSSYSKKPYIVVSAVQGYDLENKVAAWMKEGYYAQGGLSVSEGIYYQAMILVQ